MYDWKLSQNLFILLFHLLLTQLKGDGYFSHKNWHLGPKLFILQSHKHSYGNWNIFFNCWNCQQILWKHEGLLDFVRFDLKRITHHIIKKFKGREGDWYIGVFKNSIIIDQLKYPGPLTTSGSIIHRLGLFPRQIEAQQRFYPKRSIKKLNSKVVSNIPFFENKWELEKEWDKYLKYISYCYFWNPCLKYISLWA